MRTFSLLLLLILPIYVSAGLMGVFGNFLNKDSATKNSESLQNMKLLASTASPSDSVSENSLVDDSALQASGGIYQDGEAPVNGEISIYVVRDGDNLSQIAKMFGVSVNTIKWNNDITSNTLKVGETLVILPISGVKHVVVKGETLKSIATKYKGDIDEIAGFNGLDASSPLVVGSEIIIPDGEITSTPSSSGSGSNKPVYGSGLKEYVGFYLRPISGGVKTQGIHGYNAVDLAAPMGTSIMASADGQVIVARSGGWNGGYGSYVVIKHSNGTQTLYAHMSRVVASVGDTVTQGQIIGYVGQTGKATGPHVHFEIRGAKNPF